MWLVATAIFEGVELMFLRVGHTHENIDQMFSCFARQLQKTPAYSLPALVKAIERSYTPTPVVTLLESVIDFRTFAQSGLLKSWSTRDWHALKITRSLDGTVRGEYKRWMADSDWLAPPENVMFEPKGWLPPQLVCFAFPTSNSRD